MAEAGSSYCESARPWGRRFGWASWPSRVSSMGGVGGGMQAPGECQCPSIVAAGAWT